MEHDLSKVLANSSELAISSDPSKVNKDVRPHNLLKHLFLMASILVSCKPIISTNPCRNKFLILATYSHYSPPNILEQQLRRQIEIDFTLSLPLL